MKEVILKKDVINYLQKEIVRVRYLPPDAFTEVRNEDYISGYKSGQIYALTRVLNHFYTNGQC